MNSEVGLVYAMLVKNIRELSSNLTDDRTYKYMHNSSVFVVIQEALSQSFEFLSKVLLPPSPLLLTKDSAVMLYATSCYYKTRKTDTLTTFSLVLNYVTH